MGEPSKPLQQYNVNEQGERVIAASRRPDGTYRKEIRVREGFVPVEERGAYQNKAAQKLREAKNTIPGYDPVDPADQGTSTSGLSKSAKKNAKRKQKRKEAGQNAQE